MAITASAAGGNWSATGTWVGGVVPGASDDVILAATSGTITVDVTSNCRSLDASAYTHVLTLTASLNTNPLQGGAVTFGAGMSIAGFATLGISPGSGASPVTLTTAGVDLKRVNINANGTLLCADAFTVSVLLTLTQGTLNTNGQTCSWGAFSSATTNVRTLTLGSSTVTLGAGVSWDMSTITNMTLTPNTSTLIFSGTTTAFYGNATTFNNIVASGSGYFHIARNATCVNFTRTGTASKTDAFQGTNTLTVTGTATLNSNSATNRLLVQSANSAFTPNPGVAATVLVAANLVCSGVIDFQDITASGAATWSPAATGATYFGDCGGNTGITFTPGAPQTWAGNTTGNWSTTANWTSRVPLPQDDVAVNGLTSGTITVDMPRVGKSIDFTGSTNGHITLTMGISNYGSWTYVSTLIVTGNFNFNFAGRGAYTLTCAGIGPATSCSLNAPGGTLTLQDNFLFQNAAAAFNFTLGTFVANGFNVTIFSAALGAGTVNMGSGTWTLTGTGTVWTRNTTTVVPGTSTIVISNTSSTGKLFAGGTTYNNLTVPAGGGALTFSGNNTFNVITIAAPKTILSVPGWTQTYTTLNAIGVSFGYLRLSGAGSNNATSPSAAPLNITGDLDIRCRVALDKWDGTGGAQALVNKGASAGTNAYIFYINAGVPSWQWSTTGSDSFGMNAGVTVASAGFANGATLWVRATLQVNDGAGHRVGKFYTSPDGVTWTQIGSTVTVSGTTSIFSSPSALEIGTFQTSSDLTIGNFYRAQVYNGIAGTLVFDADFTTKPFGVNTFVESSSNAATVTINGPVAQQGDGRISWQSTTPGTFYSWSKASGLTVFDYGIFQDFHAIGGATAYAGGNSVNVSGNTGLIFTGPVFSHTTAWSGGGTVLETGRKATAAAVLAPGGAHFSAAAFKRGSGTALSSAAAKSVLFGNKSTARTTLSSSGSGWVGSCQKRAFLATQLIAGSTWTGAGFKASLVAVSSSAGISWNGLLHKTSSSTSTVSAGAEGAAMRSMVIRMVSRLPATLRFVLRAAPGRSGASKTPPTVIGVRRDS